MWWLLWRLFLDHLLRQLVRECRYPEHRRDDSDNRNDRGADDVELHRDDNHLDGRLFHGHVLNRHDNQPLDGRRARELPC
jgi:hypothetical protein